MAAPRSLIRLAVVAALMLACGDRPAGQAGSPTPVHEALDRYWKSDFTPVAQLAQTDDPTLVRASFITAATSWIARDQSDVINRRLVATALAIELAQARLAFDNATLVILVDWAQKEWRKGAPSASERVWTRAAVALVERGGRVHPDRWRGKASPMTSILQGRGRSDWAWAESFIDDAVRRFPEDQRLRLAAVVWASAASPDPPCRGVFARSLERSIKNPEVGPDVLVELAYLCAWEGKFEESARWAEQAATVAVEPWTRYMAHFLAASAHDKLGHYPDATREYRAALAAVPHAQSASLALAPLLLRENQPDAAFDLVARSLAERPGGEDPWRLFRYGGYIRWPVLIADVRKAIR